MKSLWIDLFIPVHSTICNLYLHLEIVPQSCVKFHFFQFLRRKKRNIFRVENPTFFCKSCIFPIIFDIFPLWEKYNFLKNHSKSVHEKCSFFTLFFSLFVCPLRLLAEIPVKFINIVWIFFVWLINI